MTPRTRLAYWLLSLSMRISDTPLRAIYTANKRLVGAKLAAMLDNDKIERETLERVYNHYKANQAALLRLYKGTADYDK